MSVIVKCDRADCDAVLEQRGEVTLSNANIGSDEQELVIRIWTHPGAEGEGWVAEYAGTDTVIHCPEHSAA